VEIVPVLIGSVIVTVAIVVVSSSTGSILFVAKIIVNDNDGPSSVSPFAVFKLDCLDEPRLQPCPFFNGNRSRQPVERDIYTDQLEQM
jgi:hypothetical protein